MRRLVDANELKGHFPQDEDWDYPVNTNSRVVEIIDDAPTVDAVEVVRCKDCRWFENDGYHTNCKIMQFCVEAEDYCSKGERKDDLISRQAAIDAADDMVEPQESEG